MKSVAFVSVAIALSALVGCASTPTSTTTVTSADVAAPAPREAVVRDMRADPTTHFIDATPDATVHIGDRPAGDLVCHVTSNEHGTAELYLKWSNTEASGTLRKITPSGMVSDTKVHAERVQGAIVADDVASTDLVSHAAMIKEHKGKKLVRVDEWKTWVPCQ